MKMFYKPSAAEVVAMMERIKSVGSPHNLRGEFTADEVRAALVRKTGETVCGATVTAHMRANFVEVERGWFSRRQRVAVGHRYHKRGDDHESK